MMRFPIKSLLVLISFTSLSCSKKDEPPINSQSKNDSTPQVKIPLEDTTSQTISNDNSTLTKPAETPDALGEAQPNQLKHHIATQPAEKLKPLYDSVSQIAKSEFLKYLPRSQLSLWGFDSPGQLEHLEIEKPVGVTQLTPNKLGELTLSQPKTFRYPLSYKGRYMTLVTVYFDSNSNSIKIGDLGGHPLAKCLESARKIYSNQEGVFWRNHILSQDFWVIVDSLKPQANWQIAELSNKKATPLSQNLGSIINKTLQHPEYKGKLAK